MRYHFHKNGISPVDYLHRRISVLVLGGPLVASGVDVSMLPHT